MCLCRKRKHKIQKEWHKSKTQHTHIKQDMSILFAESNQYMSPKARMKSSVRRNIMGLMSKSFSEML